LFVNSQIITVTGLTSSRGRTFILGSLCNLIQRNSECAWKSTNNGCQIS